MLALSGQISLGGKPVPVMEDEVGQFVIGKENPMASASPARRSISMARNIAAASTCRCAARASYPSSMPSTHRHGAQLRQAPVSTVAPQALIFMNNAFVISQSRAMAERLQAAKDDLDAQLTTGWHHAFGRAASPGRFPSRAVVHRQTALFKQRKDKTPRTAAWPATARR